MLNSIYTTIDLRALLICATGALVSGLILNLVYSVCHATRKDYSITLFLMPFIICCALMLMNSLSSSFIVMSVFALTRFRSVQYKAEEIMCIFASVIIGLLNAMGYIYVALGFTLVLSALIYVYNKAKIKTHNMLKITFPENQELSIMEEVLEKYTSSHALVDYKTTNLGSLFRATYDIVLKNPNKIQEFINEARLLNGNLEVEIGEYIESKS